MSQSQFRNCVGWTRCYPAYRIRNAASIGVWKTGENSMSELITYLPVILTAYGVFIVSIFSPGPNILSIIGTSMAVDRPSGKALACGIASGSFLWGLLAWLGLTAILVTYASVMVAIKIIGAVYLLWLAFKAFRSASRQKDIAPEGMDLGGRPAAYYRRGLLIQMTNPKAALAWAAIMSLGISVGAPWWVGGTIVAGTTILSFAGHLAYAVVFSTPPMVKVYARARRWIEAGLGLFFCFASYRLLTTRTI